MNLIKILLVFSILFITFFITGCSTKIMGYETKGLSNMALDTARHKIQKGEHLQASLFLTSVAKIDPDFPELEQLKSQISHQDTDVFYRPLLGSNRALRYPKKRSWITRIALYIPDRILDLTDIITFDIHLGTGIFANAHVTRAVQIGAGARSVGGFGLHPHRNLGFQYQGEAGINILPMGLSAYNLGAVGVSGVRSASDSFAGLHTPHKPVYQEYRDYWAVGGGLTALFVGVDVNIHPLQIADFLGGIFLLDFLYDDFATTRGLGLNKREKELLIKLNRIARSQQALLDYEIFNNHTRKTPEVLLPEECDASVSDMLENGKFQ